MNYSTSSPFPTLAAELISKVASGGFIHTPRKEQSVELPIRQGYAAGFAA